MAAAWIETEGSYALVAERVKLGVRMGFIPDI
jgi:hypothetical protein